MDTGEILIYQNDEGNIKIDVRLESETVWLTQDQIAVLFGKSKSTINEHIKNIYSEGELEESTSLKKFGISEFQQKAPKYYNLDVIISVGYRVKSQQGTQFRIWATQRLKEYIVKGFALNDERFKSGNSMNYMALDKSGAEYEKFKEEQKKLSKEASLKEIEEDIKKLKKLPKK
jgi:hypothetical protein